MGVSCSFRPIFNQTLCKMVTPGNQLKNLEGRHFVRASGGSIFSEFLPRWRAGLIFLWCTYSIPRFGRRYETPLLIQSILMNIAMFALLHLCVNLRAKEQILRGEDHIYTGKKERAKRPSEQPEREGINAGWGQSYSGPSLPAGRVEMRSSRFKLSFRLVHSHESCSNFLWWKMVNLLSLGSFRFQMHSKSSALGHKIFSPWLGARVGSQVWISMV